ncbi:phosphatidylethanolamine N-methyltransferase [Quaeritorhiza haematococci]|nr:phosphatidylethanolamine N-methyltransferase [Quaeritorhiza haematococci]
MASVLSCPSPPILDDVDLTPPQLDDAALDRPSLDPDTPLTGLNGQDMKGSNESTHFDDESEPLLGMKADAQSTGAELGEDGVSGGEPAMDGSIGKTPDGTVFKVPTTHDMIKTLFSPSSPHTFFEWAVLSALAIEASLFFFTSAPREVFLVLFLMWRIAYNVGLGLLLKAQSDSKLIVRWCKRMGFGANAKGKRRIWVEFMIDQLKKKMGPDYDYENVPIEFNSWLLFRGLVDLILVNDFTCYILFACAYYQAPADGHTFFDVLRYFGGVVLLAFNLWVKVDAHRVVKDFAWYWGDFFYLIEASLTFDGVFEMAPHPMYSVGYIGFYGSALIAQSYWVLFVSLVAHAAQFAFLYWVENPHIDKTYNTSASSKLNLDREVLQLYFRRDLIVFKNFDWFRSSDLFSVAIAAYSIVVAFVIGSIDEDWKLWFYVGQALFWRIIHTYVLGGVLYLQSENKFWTKHFIKHGERPRDAFQHWKIIYNLSQSMTYISFFLCAWRLYSLPENWTYGTILLRHTLGALLIMLHLWTALSIYEVLGDFGWFYGDFFIDPLRSNRDQLLRYTGIYRFLNNPEKIMGHASCWGITLICNSWVVFSLTLFGQISTWLFLRYVETPHMYKLYGGAVRKEAGVKKVIKKEVRKVKENVEKMIRKEVVDKVVQNLKTAISKPSNGSEPSTGVVSSGTLKAVARKWEEGVTPEGSPSKKVTAKRNGAAAYGQSPISSDGDWRSDSPSDDDDEDVVQTEAWEEQAEEEAVEEVHQQRQTHLRHRRPKKLFNEPEDEDDSPSSTGKLTKRINGKGSIHSKKKRSSGMRVNSLSKAMEAGRQVVEDLALEMEKVVDSAKPKVQAIVEKIANVTLTDDFATISRLPLHHYSVTFPTQASDDQPIVFKLGEPITIEFTTTRESVKPKDWIGIYKVTQNFKRDLTTSRSGGRWLFVTGNYKDAVVPSSENGSVSSPATATTPTDDTNAPVIVMAASSSSADEESKTGLLGKIPVEVTPIADEPGLRLVRGRITFRGFLLPWECGVYEARYHHDGKYVVCAISRPFEIVVDPYRSPISDGNSASAADQEDQTTVASAPEEGTTEATVYEEEEIARIEAKLCRVVETCLELESNPTVSSAGGDGECVLGMDDDILEVAQRVFPSDGVSVSKYQEEVSSRIVYTVKQTFGVEFSWKVVGLVVSVRKFARRIYEARVALAPIVPSSASRS